MTITVSFEQHDEDWGLGIFKEEDGVKVVTDIRRGRIDDLLCYVHNIFGHRDVRISFMDLRSEGVKDR